MLEAVNIVTVDSFRMLSSICIGSTSSLVFPDLFSSFLFFSSLKPKWASWGELWYNGCVYYVHEDKGDHVLMNN